MALLKVMIFGLIDGIMTVWIDDSVSNVSFSECEYVIIFINVCQSQKEKVYSKQKNFVGKES